MDRHGIRLTVELGDLVAALYDAFLEAYHDEELALLATASAVQKRMLDGSLAFAESKAA